VVSRARKTMRINHCYRQIRMFRRLVNHCALPSIGQAWVLAPIGAVFEMGDLIGH
jgi:hypothetical protein